MRQILISNNSGRSGSASCLLCALALVCCLTLLRFAGFATDAAATGADTGSGREAGKRILLLSSYHLTNNWTAGVIETIISDTQQLPDAPKFDIDDYDAMRDPSASAMEQLWREHLSMLKSGQYDLLVLLDEPVIEIVLRHGADLPPELPVVFAGLGNNPETPQTLPANFTGVFREDRPEDTLRTAVALYPHTKKILVISDASPQSLKFESQLKAQNLSVNGITPEYLNTAELNQNDIFRRLAAMPPNTILMLSPWRGLYGNGYRTMAAFAADLRNSWKRPFFVNGTALLEHGALGGYVSDPTLTGHAAAKLISAVLQTGNTNGLVPVCIRAVPEFDYKELMDNGLDPRKIPHDAILRNRPPTIWDRHRSTLIVGGAGMLLAGCCLIGLLAGGLWISKRNAKRVKNFYFSLPARVGAITKNERILYISADASDDNMVKQAKTLKEIPGIDYEKVSAAVKQVFATGRRQTLNYVSGSTRRSISIARLPSKIFGEEAVVWLSHDNSELREARKQAEESSSRLREQLELWNMVIDALPIMLFIKRPTDDFRYTMTNRFFDEFVGRAHDEVIGKNDIELFPSSKDASSFRAWDARVMANGQCEIEETATDRFGKLHSLRTTKMPFVSSGGERLLLGMTVDISELNRRINEHKLTTFCLKTMLQEKSLEAGFHKISQAVCNHFSASRAFVMQFDIDRKTMANRSEYVSNGKKTVFGAVRDRRFTARPDWAERLRTNHSIAIRDFSKSKHEDFGISWMPLIEQENFRSMYVNRLMLEGRVWGYAALTFEDDVRELDDGELSLLDDLAHFIDMMLERDRGQRELIALWKQADRDNEEKSRLLIQAQAADKAKSFFIASVSHEIRTPLNAVIGFANLLKDESLPPETRCEYLESIVYSGNALLQLINDVLDLSKLEADRLEFTPEPMRFADTAEDSMRLFAPKAAKLGLELELEIEEMPELLLDKSRIRQILFNLIGNAVKFTEQGKVALRAKFTPDESSDSGELFFEVFDTGIGISPEDRAKLLEPFVQLSNLRGSNAEHNGTGLGLSICKRLVEKMNGHIQIASEVDKGSSFSVRLPGVAIAGTAAEDKRTAQTQDASPDNDRPLPSTTSILIVDDVEMNIKVMCAMCRKAGITDITTAESGEAALKALGLRRFDLALTDMWMPNMNGAELAGAIRSMPQYSEFPLIAVTADIEAGEHFGMELFTAVLHKPVTPEKLKAAIAAAIAAPPAAQRQLPEKTIPEIDA